MIETHQDPDDAPESHEGDGEQFDDLPVSGGADGGHAEVQKKRTGRRRELNSESRDTEVDTPPHRDDDVERGKQGGSDAPASEMYVTARWLELTDGAAPWWTRSQGIGIRLRLHELLDIAQARYEGATIDRPVADLRAEARATLAATSRFLRDRHGRTADQLRAALEEEQRDPLPPRGLNYSIIEAAFEQLNSPKLRPAIIDELSTKAAAADSFDKLLSLDEYIELIDAELAYDGHSSSWRRRVAEATSARVHAGEPIADAITESITDGESTWPRNVRFLIPVRILRPRREATHAKLADADMVRRQLELWNLDVPEGEGFELSDDGAFDLEIENAADVDAAVARAGHWLEQELALFRLQGGELEPLDAWLAIHSDGLDATVQRRPEPLWLLPKGMDVVKELLSQEPRKARGREHLLLPDAFVQLAQARTGSPGAALSDLWTVAEAVFGGAATEDKRYLAGEVMSELLEYLYPLALLDWMGGRLEDLGMTKPQTRTRAAWALGEFERNAKRAFAVCTGNADPLLFARCRSFGRWSGRHDQPSDRMGEELKAISRRFERIAARAYLVRNFHVHRAQPNRAAALAATLPVFAELVRVALGYVASNNSRADRPITSAKLALLRIRQVVFDFENGNAFGARPLRAALEDDLNVD